MHSHALIFIQDLAIIMLVAGMITVLCHQFRQPIVFGYIIAGIIIGPHTPPYPLITDMTIVKTLAELGVIFLMLSLGLEFNLRKLSQVGLVACLPALLEIILMMLLGYIIGRTFDWSELDSLFLGAILAISSSTIIVKALSDLGLKRKPFAQFIFGILIIEDIFAVLILVLLSGIATTGSLHAGNMLITIVQLSAFMVVTLLIGILIVPKFLNYIATFNNKEMMLVSVLGLCFGFCYLVSLFEYSVALGAFMMGAMIAESRQINSIEQLVEPVRDMFSAIFFVSVGLLFDPSVISRYALPVTVVILAIVFGKIITCSLGALVAGKSPKTSLRVGMGLAQIGEFSFIIAALGITLGVTSDFLYSIAVAASIVTTILTPYFIVYSDKAADLLAVLIPEKVKVIASVYETWIKNIEPEESRAILMKQIKKSMLNIIVNLLVVAAIFMVGVYVNKMGVVDNLLEPLRNNVRNTIIWGVAVLLSLPFLIAIFRKINALAQIAAEMKVSDSIHQHYTIKVRKIIAPIISVLSFMGVMIFIMVLSVGILPPVEMLVLLLLLLLGVAAIFYPWFVKLHAKLQISLIETLTKDK